MARDAFGKLREADTLNKEAAKIKKRDPVSAVALDSLATAKRKSAIKQLRRKPGSSKRRAIVL